MKRNISLNKTPGSKDPNTADKSHEPQPNVSSAPCHSAQTRPIHPSTHCSTHGLYGLRRDRLWGLGRLCDRCGLLQSKHTHRRLMENNIYICMIFTGDRLAHMWTLHIKLQTEKKTVIFTIGPSCAHGDDVIGGNISEKDKMIVRHTQNCNANQKNKIKIQLVWII